MRQGYELEKNQNFSGAILKYQSVLHDDPGNLAASQLLGMLYFRQEEYRLAEPLIAKVVKFETRKADIQCVYANILSSIGRHSESIQYYKKALTLTPNYLIALNKLCKELVDFGQFDEAITWTRKFLAFQPRCVGAYRQLARLSNYTEYNEDIRIMEELYENANLADRQALAFSLSNVYKKLSQFEKSFEFLLEGNRLQSESINYSHEVSEKIFHDIQQTFDSDFFANAAPPPNSEITPIFILGMPRSGTTLTEQILATHSAVYGAGELDYMGRLHSTIRRNASLPNGENLRDMSAQKLATLAEGYLNELRMLANGENYITDKMPHNFLSIGLIALLFPSAKIIHCERNPMDNCYSIFTYLFNDEHAYACNQEHLGRYYLLYQELMEHWQRVLPGRLYTVKYEQMVDNTEQQVRMLLDHCGLPFEEACLSFYDTDRAVKTISATQVRRPIYKSSIDGWKRFERELQPLKKTLGI